VTDHVMNIPTAGGDPNVQHSPYDIFWFLTNAGFDTSLMDPMVLSQLQDQLNQLPPDQRTQVLNNLSTNLQDNLAQQSVDMPPAQALSSLVQQTFDQSYHQQQQQLAASSIAPPSPTPLQPRPGTFGPPGAPAGSTPAGGAPAGGAPAGGAPAAKTVATTGGAAAGGAGAGTTATHVAGTDAPPPDTTSQTPGQYGTFATEAQRLFGPTGLATYGAAVPWGEQFLSDELTQVQATGGASGAATDPYAQNWTKGGGLTGYVFGGVSGPDIQRVLGMAESWAALTGWKYFPPAQVIQILARQPGLSQQSAYEQFWQQLPQDIRTKSPGLEFGLDQTQFQTKVGGIQSAYQNWAGPNESLDPAIVQRAMQENWSPTQIDQFLLNDPGVQAKAPWMAAGKTYHDWQLYQKDPAATAAVTSRFGASGVNSANFLTNLLNPVAGGTGRASGGAITPQQHAGRQAAPSGFGSEVR